MPDSHERVCVGCSETGDRKQLEVCGICAKLFCADCAHRAGYGRRFCSPECARAYYFSGEPDDDEDESPDD